MIAGYISTGLLASCGTIEGIKAFRTGKCGISKVGLTVWFLGEAFGIYHVYPMNDLPLLLNFGINVVATTYLMWVKFGKR